MRILQVHNRYRSGTPSGENNVVDLEASALMKTGHVVERYQCSNDAIDAYGIVDRVRIPQRYVWNGETKMQLTEAIAKFKPDLVHVHNLYPILSASALYACKYFSVPVVATFHNYRLVCAAGTLFRNGRPCHDCLGRGTVRGVWHGCFQSSRTSTVPVAMEHAIHKRAWNELVSAYICISRAQRELMLPSGIPASRTFVKWNMVEHVERGTELQRRAAVLYAGRLDEVKGIPLLMRAWEEYARVGRETGLSLLIAGSGPLEGDVRSWASGRSDVQVLGLLSPLECRRTMATVRAAIVPSVWDEPFGLVVVEAMAAGTAVVTPNTGAFPELLGDLGGATMYQQGVHTSLARVLREIEVHPSRFDGYGMTLRHAYEQNFDPNKNLQQLEGIYEFAIANPASSAGRWSNG